jgi:vancomycin resistance protein YoaR
MNHFNMANPSDARNLALGNSREGFRISADLQAAILPAGIAGALTGRTNEEIISILRQTQAAQNLARANGEDPVAATQTVFGNKGMNVTTEDAAKLNDDLLLMQQQRQQQAGNIDALDEYALTPESAEHQKELTAKMEKVANTIQGPISPEELEQIAETNGFSPEQFEEVVAAKAEQQAAANPRNPSNITISENPLAILPAFLTYPGLATEREIAEQQAQQKAQLDRELDEQLNPRIQPNPNRNAVPQFGMMGA